MDLIITNTKYGRFLVNPEDSYVARSLIKYGEYCEGEVSLLSQLIDNNSIVVDIGANIGALSIPLAQKAKAVFCFEPHPFNYNILCANIALSNLKNIEAYKVGIGSSTRTMRIQDIELFKHNNGAHNLLDDDESDTNSSRTLITNQIPACNLIKIDVEGMELDVLKGITATINECQPFLFVENDRVEKSFDLISYIEDTLNYKAYWCSWCLFNPNNFNNNKENIFGDVGCINMICVPKSTNFSFTEIDLSQVNRNQPSPYLL